MSRRPAWLMARCHTPKRPIGRPLRPRTTSSERRFIYLNIFVACITSRSRQLFHLAYLYFLAYAVENFQWRAPPYAADRLVFILRQQHITIYRKTGWVDMDFEVFLDFFHKSHSFSIFFLCQLEFSWPISWEGSLWNLFYKNKYI